MKLPNSKFYCLIALLLTATCTTAVHAQEQDENKARRTILDIADADDDFHDMGEYQGPVQFEGREYPIGLQVVAMGDGEFVGMQYDGGLPGTGWDGNHRAKLEGMRAGDSIMLSGDEVHFVIADGKAAVHDPNGELIGNIPMVHRKSPTLGKPAPANAYTLFDGTDTKVFKNGKISDAGLLQEGTELLHKFRDFTMHVEYRLPYMPYARGQERSNSGLYLQSSYEVQVLDSFGLEGVENQCGALYRYQRPNQNMCLPPLSWQTYDLTFHSPRFDSEGNKIQNARITVLHNGVAVHDDFEIERKTGAGKVESPTIHPIKFQDHSNPIRYRNIWLIDLGAQQGQQHYAQQPMTHVDYSVAAQTMCAQPMVSTRTAPVVAVRRSVCGHWRCRHRANGRHARFVAPTPVQMVPSLSQPACASPNAVGSPVAAPIAQPTATPEPTPMVESTEAAPAAELNPTPHESKPVELPEVAVSEAAETPAISEAAVINPEDAQPSPVDVTQPDGDQLLPLPLPSADSQLQGI